MKIKINFDNNLNQNYQEDRFDNLNDEQINLNQFGKSGIKIKEKNKGSFTEYCGGKVTNECIQRAKNSPNPAIRKKAVFAENARKWKHQEGGEIGGSSSALFNELLYNLSSNSNSIPGVNTGGLIPGFNSSSITTLLNNVPSHSDANDLDKLLKSGIKYSNPEYELPSNWMDAAIEDVDETTKDKKEEDNDPIPTFVRADRRGAKFQSGGIMSRLMIGYEPFQGVDNMNFSPGVISTEIDNSTVFENESSPSEYEKQKKQAKENEIPGYFNKSYKADEDETSQEINPKVTKGERYKIFKRYFNEVISEDPSAAKYEKVLTDIAYHESRFNYSIRNTAGAPAFGYFQFWQDGKTNNITHYSGLSKDDFLKNPKAQIKAAVKMAKDVESKFSKKDLRLAAQKGYNMNCLIRGAWLGGVGGVRQVLNGTGNPNDGKWYKNGKGHSVKDAMEEQKHNIL